MIPNTRTGFPCGLSDTGSKGMESLFDCRNVRPQVCFAELEKNVCSCRGLDFRASSHPLHVRRMTCASPYTSRTSTSSERRSKENILPQSLLHFLNLTCRLIHVITRLVLHRSSLLNPRGPFPIPCMGKCWVLITDKGNPVVLSFCWARVWRVGYETFDDKGNCVCPSYGSGL